MLDRNIDKVERIIELTSNSGKKEQFRVGDVVDINYRKPFDPRGVGYNGDAGLTGRIADIKDAVIYVDAGTLFHSNIVAITLDTVAGLIKTSERRQSIRSVRGGVEHGSRIIKAGIYSLYHSGSRIIGSRYTLV